MLAWEEKKIKIRKAIKGKTGIDPGTASRGAAPSVSMMMDGAIISIPDGCTEHPDLLANSAPTA